MILVRKTKCFENGLESIENTEEPKAMITHLVYVSPGYVQKRDQELQLDQRLQIGEAISNVLHLLAVQLRADRAGRPQVVHVAEFVVQPEAGICFLGHG